MQASRSRCLSWNASWPLPSAMRSASPLTTTRSWRLAMRLQRSSGGHARSGRPKLKKVDHFDCHWP